MAASKEILEQRKENIELETLISALNRYSLEGFIESELASFLQAFDLMIRNSCQNSTAPLHNFAKEISAFFSLWATIPSWQHFSAYLANPKAYQEEYERNSSNTFHWYLTLDIANNGIKLFFKQCQEHLILLVKHTHSIIEKKKREYSFFSSFDPNFKLELLVGELLEDSTFRDWLLRAKGYFTESENIVTQLQEQNRKQWDEFKNLQSQLRVIHWPHSLQLRKNIEEAGFVYRPTLIKRNRCLCERCGNEITVFLPWLSPESYHDFSKHSAQYKKAIEERLLKRQEKVIQDAPTTDTKKTTEEEITSRPNGKRKIATVRTNAIEATLSATPMPTAAPMPSLIPVETSMPIPAPTPLPVATTPLQATAEIISLEPFNSLTPLYSLTQSQNLMPEPIVPDSNDEFALLGEAVFGNKRSRFENTSAAPDTSSGTELK